MSLGIGTPGAASRWTSYAAWTQLRNHQRQLATDIADRAEPRVLVADQAAVRDSERRLRQLRPGHTLDVLA
jgi:hypothetical protein